MAEYTVALTPADRRRTAALAGVRRIPDKGQGVVAVRDIPAWTLVGPYPGLRTTHAGFSKRKDQGHTTGKYAVDFWKPDKNGHAKTGYVLDPGHGNGTLRPEFAHAVAPMINEPNATPPNLVWVWNLPKYRMEHWTCVPVKKGQELTICYGTGGGYERDYTTACVSQPGVEPQLHVVATPGGKPVAYGTLGNAGVQRAINSLK